VLPSISAIPSEGALALFRQARFTECLERLRDSANAADVILRAESLLCLRRPSEIIRMDSLAQLADAPKPLQFMAQSIIASAFYRLGLKDPGDAALSAAYENVRHAPDLRAKLWVDFTAAKERWTAGDYDAAERLARPAARVDGVLGAKALALLAWVEAGREHFDKQAELLRQAWDVLPLEEDVYTGVTILRALSHLSCELFDESLAQFVERANDRLPWPPDMSFEQIETMRAIAWNYALSGKIVQSIRQFRKNEHLARSPAGQLLVLADRARIAYGSGESAHYHALLEDASEIAQHVDWSNATAEQRFGLLSLAALWAPANPIQARDEFHRYQNVTVPMNPMVAWARSDSRRQAAEHYAAGVVCRYLDQRTEAIQHLRKAFSIYRRLKYYWRACLCAHHLSDLGYDKGTVDAALIWIRERFPHAWFTPLFRQAQAFERDAIVAQLTKAPREILRLLLRDMSTREIAKALERDEKTVRNHISEIFRSFDVKTREELVKVCETRGLT
jgi:DNA-binding CsgD family transcriptional regulator